ncbi:MAG: N-acetyl-gamma-glutamyl-phosphate reductase [SAR202 cluster bacterium]|nr:N-acetyl-gamma-glutamyl-phosphate reductase [SAR202 cluster bacterium]
MKVGIVNVTGYAGVELARLLYRHPEAEVAAVTGRTAAGKKLAEVFPHLSAMDLTITEDLNESVDVVISALPQTASAERLAPVVAQGVKAIDISPDFRLKSVDEYKTWYKIDHPCPQYLESAVFGLPELNRQEVVASRLIANPGCYSTAVILALAPAVKHGIIGPDIIADCKSGVSGAGRSLSLGTHFSEVNENVMAYSVDGHRHLPEVTQELARLAPGSNLRVTLLMHLIPMTRGILVSCYAPLRDGAVGHGERAKAEVRDLYRSFYKGEPFVQVVPDPPQTKQTAGSNNCTVFTTVDARTNRLIVIACLDNLVKGAAGQAIQNMNIMFGLPEDEGLGQLGLFP